MSKTRSNEMRKCTSGTPQKQQEKALARLLERAARRSRPPTSEPALETAQAEGEQLNPSGLEGVGS